MGGRGASSSGKHGKYGKNSQHTYGSEFTTVYKSGNIKFVIANAKSNKAPMETQTPRRVYVTIDKNTNEPKYISYYDKNNMRNKTIDLKHKHMGIEPHTHHGYEHNENDGPKGATKLDTKEKKMVDKVNDLWYNYLNGKA